MASLSEDPEMSASDDEEYDYSELIGFPQMSMMSLEELLEDNIPAEVDSWQISFRTGFVYANRELTLRV